MRSLSDRARQRIVAWMDGNPKITQAVVAQGVGVTQSWVSQYRKGDIEANIDQLSAMAEVFGHTLNELLDLRPDPKDRELLDAFRALRPEARALAIEMLRAMIPQPAARARSRK